MRTGITVLATISAIVGPGTIAHADDILAAGSLFGSTAQSRAVCVFYNAGNTNVTLRGFQITDPSGTSQTLIINQCGTSPAALGPRTACGIAAAASNNTSYSCRVRIVPDKTNVRGVLDMRDTDQNVLATVDLR